MHKSYIFSGIIVLLSTFSFFSNASDSGTVTFQGMIVESQCSLNVSKNENIYGCAKDVALKESNRKEETTAVNLENLIDISNFPKKNGQTKEFNIQGNNMKITKMYNEKYKNLYHIDINIQ